MITLSRQLDLAMCDGDVVGAEDLEGVCDGGLKNGASVQVEPHHHIP